MFANIIASLITFVSFAFGQTTQQNPPSVRLSTARQPSQLPHSVPIGTYPEIVNETKPDPNAQYQLLFSYTNDKLKDEAMAFYAKLDPQTGFMNNRTPVIWRRVVRGGGILTPKELQLKKVKLLFTYNPSSNLPMEVIYNLHFNIYKPGTPNSDPGIDVPRQFVVKKISGSRYEAYFLRGERDPLPLKQIHAKIHIKNLMQAMINEPNGTNAFWVRVTAENGEKEYIVADNYAKNSSSMPQKSDPSWKPTGVRFVGPLGNELPIIAKK